MPRPSTPQAGRWGVGVALVQLEELVEADDRALAAFTALAAGNRFYLMKSIVQSVAPLPIVSDERLSGSAQPD